MGRFVRMSCFRPAAVVMEGEWTSRRRSGREAEKRMVRGRVVVSLVGGGVMFG